MLVDIDVRCSTLHRQVTSHLANSHSANNSLRFNDYIHCHNTVAVY